MKRKISAKKKIGAKPTQFTIQKNEWSDATTICGKNKTTQHFFFLSYKQAIS